MSKMLVAYFSATGITAQVAKQLAKVAEADLYEIRPAKPYTEADLNWTNNQSLSAVDMSDPRTRPAMTDKYAHIE